MSQYAEGSSSDEEKNVLTPKQNHQDLYKYMVLVLVHDDGYRGEDGSVKRQALRNDFKTVLSELDKKENEEKRRMEEDYGVGKNKDKEEEEEPSPRVEAYEKLKQMHSIAEGDVRKDDSVSGRSGKYQLAKFFWDLIAELDLAGSLQDIHWYAKKSHVKKLIDVDPEILMEYDNAKKRRRFAAIKGSISWYLSIFWKNLVDPEQPIEESRFDNFKKCVAEFSKISDQWAWKDWADNNRSDPIKDKYRTDFVRVILYFRLPNNWIRDCVYEPLTSERLEKTEGSLLDPETHEPLQTETRKDYIRERDRIIGFETNRMALKDGYNSKWNHLAPTYKVRRPFEVHTKAQSLYRNWINVVT
jgi:hypothetical protein